MNALPSEIPESKQNLETYNLYLAEAGFYTQGIWYDALLPGTSSSDRIQADEKHAHMLLEISDGIIALDALRKRLRGGDLSDEEQQLLQTTTPESVLSKLDRVIQLISYDK